MKGRHHVWIVEMLCDDGRRKRWEPTVGVGFTQEDGKAECRLWRQRNPADLFRLVQYYSSRVGER